MALKSPLRGAVIRKIFIFKQDESETQVSFAVTIGAGSYKVIAWHAPKNICYRQSDNNYTKRKEPYMYKQALKVYFYSKNKKIKMYTLNVYKLVN